VEIPINKNGTNILEDIKYCFKLKKLMQEQHPDIVLGYTVKPVVYGSIAAKLAGVKNINCLITGGGYTLTATSLKARVLGVIVRTLYKIGLGCANTVIFQNKDDLNEFVSRKLVAASKCRLVAGSGVDLNRFAVADFPTQTTFFMLSRLLKSKGVLEYLKACEIVKKRYPDVRFTLLGKYEHNMQDAIEETYVENLITDGVIERFGETYDVSPYYRACSVYILPSYREGTPRTVLEAMSMGRPIITSDAPGCRETVIDGETGFLIPIKDVDALVEKMCFFIENQEEIPKMGAASRAFCEQRFAVEKVNKQMLLHLQIEEAE